MDLLSRSSNVRYRALSASELGAAADLFLSTLADMAERNGLPRPKAFTRETVDPLYAHLHATGIFRCAERDERLISICAGVVRGDRFFLSMFWTAKEAQRQGIGGPLLAEVWEEAQRRGAREAFTWSSIDFTAIATYLKMGMFPGGPILAFAGAPTFSGRPSHATLEALSPRFAIELDEEVWGDGRAVDHEAYFSRTAVGHQVRASGRLLGYFYAGQGVVGPAAWRETGDAEMVLDAAARTAHTQAAEIRLVTTGWNTDAIAFALRQGLRLVGTSHLLRTRTFGRLDCYLPSGPGLF